MVQEAIPGNRLFTGWGQDAAMIMMAPASQPRPPAHWLNIAAMLADLAFETNIGGRFTAFGSADVLGFAADDLLGRKLSDLVVPENDSSLDAITFGSIIAGLYSRNQEWRGTVMLRRADGSQGNYQLFLAPKIARAGEDNLDGAYGLLIDRDAAALPARSPDNERASAMLDPQTGLWSAATFAEEAGRRFDRLDVEGLPGTLILLGFSRTKPIGHSAVAIRLAEELRDIIRPTDLLGRLDATTFALWCDGMDDLTGAERAARFCQRLPAALPGQPCISVGLSARWPNKAEDTETLIRQARAALSLADRIAQAAADAGSTESVAAGTWRAWNPSLSGLQEF
jgi:GGDEF domain-containing protein